MSCLTPAWSQHQHERRNWSRHKLRNQTDVEDFLQDLFLKVLRQGDRFCSVQNARAWLFEVAQRPGGSSARGPGNGGVAGRPGARVEETEAVHALTACLPRVLSELSAEDREAITLCDLQGMLQAEFAKLKGLGLSAAKSRIQRARQRLRAQMTQACRVQIDRTGHVADFVPRA